jgi:hypothetical protein
MCGRPGNQTPKDGPLCSGPGFPVPLQTGSAMCVIPAHMNMWSMAWIVLKKRIWSVN